eukprot:TRINITY_DN149_c0_g2_i2.p3 TRINITY_DN149_c0_g2~~TRINITY_DN149_c0_g2_i2.p3  ORF type:complete len:107 (-),score=0.54 TRINITY_DN149_c0_g2_i2:550-870(-)
MERLEEVRAGLRKKKCVFACFCVGVWSPDCNQNRDIKMKGGGKRLLLRTRAEQAGGLKKKVKKRGGWGGCAREREVLAYTYSSRWKGGRGKFFAYPPPRKRGRGST